MAGALVESGEVGAAELGVSCVLVGWPIPAGALFACCLVEVSDRGMHGADQGETDCGAGGDCEEWSAHRSQAA